MLNNQVQEFLSDLKKHSDSEKAKGSAANAGRTIHTTVVNRNACLMCSSSPMPRLVIIKLTAANSVTAAEDKNTKLSTWSNDQSTSDGTSINSPRGSNKRPVTKNMGR